MIIRHLDKTPLVDASSFVAANATVCGDVTFGKNVRVMFGAQIIAENSPIKIGDNCIILENAVIRGTDNFPVNIGNNCLVGPNAHLAGCTLDDNVFIATGASIFHGSHLKKGSEVRVNGVVHLKTILPENAVVPIGWVAVGHPAQILSPEKHEEIWAIQKTLDFQGTVYEIDRTKFEGSSYMEQICKVMADRLNSHANNEVISRE